MNFVSVAMFLFDLSAAMAATDKYSLLLLCLFVLDTSITVVDVKRHYVRDVRNQVSDTRTIGTVSVTFSTRVKYFPDDIYAHT